MVAARRLEIEYAEKKPAWKTVHRCIAKHNGREIMKSRLIDINKGDDVKPNYRSRMVGKEFNDRGAEGLFAATSSLEVLRLLLSWAATGTDGGRLSTVGTGRSIMIADVSTAFCDAPVKRDICVELPAEALSPGEIPENTVGELLASLYGARDASANWQAEVSKCMKEWGFVAGKYNPCMFHHPSRQVLCLVHGDDFFSVGDAGQLQWLKERLKGRFEIKTSTVGLREDKGEVREARILNRVIRVSGSGWEYDADQRHADLIIQETGAHGMSILTLEGKRM